MFRLLFGKTASLKKESGFTLIELLVVIAIIGILSTLVLLQLGTARQRSRDAKRVADINQIRSALELFFDDNNSTYPITNNLVALQTAGYITLVPTDPLKTTCGTTFIGNGCYGYANRPAASPTQFHVWAELERSSTALAGDADYNSTGTPPGGVWANTPVNGGSPNELCGDTSTTAINCVYDLAQTL